MDDPELSGKLGAAAGEREPRAAGRFSINLDVQPADSPAPAGTQRLEHRLLAGEAGGVTLRPPASAGIRVR